MSTIDFAALASGDELSIEDILAIEQAGSEKGIYQRDLLDFVHSNKLGAPYKFSGKNAQSVKTGFTGAVDALQKKEDVSAEDKAAVKEVEVRVRKTKSKDEAGNDVEQEFVFLINNNLVKQARGGSAAPASDENGTAGTTEDETEPATV